MQNRPHQFPGSNDENELDVGRIIKEYQSGGSGREPASDTATAASYADTATPQPASHTAEKPSVPQRAKGVKKSAGQILLSILDSVIPHKGDSVLEVVRKCVFVIALMTLAGSLSYLAYDMVVIPIYSESVYNEIADMYDPTKPPILPEGAEDFDFLAGMSDSFKALYMENTDVRGFITYQTNRSDNFLNIRLPIVRGLDNEYYLTHNFYKVKEKNGCLFFDMENVIETPEDKNKVTIVYGHNMASGHMFAPLNKFLGNIAYIRSAPVISMDTVFEQAKYKVFAVVVANVDDEDGPPFNYLVTGNYFSDSSFLNYINEVRARSYWDFEDAVDVQADDEILVLSTCTSESAVHFDNGRLAVFARKIRPGESEDVNVNLIKKNDDVIMPLAWYLNQGLEPHPYYSDVGYVIPSISSTPEDTSPTQESTVTPPSGGEQPTTSPAAPTDSQAPVNPTNPPVSVNPTDPITTPTEPQTPTEPEPPPTEPPGTETAPESTESTESSGETETTELTEQPTAPTEPSAAPDPSAADTQPEESSSQTEPGQS